MIAILDALVSWRQASIPALFCSHTLSSNAKAGAYPSSRLAAKTGTFVVPVCVPIDLEETVTVEGNGEEDNALLTSIVASLKTLDPARPQSRIHSHVLVSEQYGVDANLRRQAVLRWRVVASWK